MSKPVDLTGQKFGRLLVVGMNPIRGKDKKIWWNCVCDCGVFTKFKGIRLTRGKGVHSCGCFVKERMRELAAIESKKKIGKVSTLRLPDGEAARNALYNSYKNGAVKRGLEFLLSKEQFKDLTRQNCAYCGSIPKATKWNHYHSACVYNGIDRMDNKVGYSLENCLPCCKMCNYAKANSTLHEFIEWIKRVSKHLNLIESLDREHFPGR